MMKNKLKTYQYIIMSLLGFVLACSSVNAQQNNSNPLSGPEVRETLKKGKVLSYETVLSSIKREKSDRIIEAELISFDGLIIYHIEILKASGVVVSYLIDGKTGEDASYLRDE